MHTSLLSSPCFHGYTAVFNYCPASSCTIEGTVREWPNCFKLTSDANASREKRTYFCLPQKLHTTGLKTVNGCYRPMHTTRLMVTTQRKLCSTKS